MLQQQFSVGPAGGKHHMVEWDQGAAALGTDLPDIAQDGAGWRHDPGRLGELDLQFDALASARGLCATMRGVQGQLSIAFPEVQRIDVEGDSGIPLPGSWKEPLIAMTMLLRIPH